MAHGDSRDPDGIEVFRDGSLGRRQLRVVLAVVAVVAAVVVMLSATAVLVLRGAPEPQPHASRAAVDAGVPAARPAAKVVVPVPSATAGEPPRVAGERPGAAPAAKSPADAPAPKEAARSGTPTPAAETEEPLLSGLVRNAVDSLAGAGSGGGIAVYPPKGTNPVKTGIVVPEDFALPEGYVRYHQVTDDGRRLEPILMFSPDYEFVGPDGKPAAIPDNRIVPPEMAPPGLTVRMLDVPADESSPAAGR
jgi:hypothetical protein